jgi:hypothetical protein
VRAFIVYRPDSGEVVHVHLQPSDLEIEVDEVLAMVEPSRGQRLAVLEVPSDKLPATGFAVREGELVEVEDAGAGGGGTDTREQGTRTYEDLRSNR